MASGARAKAVRLVEELGAFLGPASDCAVVAWDSSEAPGIFAASGSCARVFGLASERLLGTRAHALFHGGERALRDLVRRCTGGTLQAQSKLVRTPGSRRGGPFAAQLQLRTLTGTGLVALVRDLTKAQGEVDAALRAEDLGRFASLVAHEVRNPLSSVKIALQTFERGGRLLPNDLRRSAIAIREVGSIEALLSEVLDYARPLSLALVPLDPRVIVREAVVQLEAEWRAREVRFAVTLPARMPPVMADRTRLLSAIQILGRQAAASTEEAGGGKVEIRIEDGRTAWQLRVRDPGRPLPAAQRKNAFVPFSPARARGSGLGLAVVAKVANEHGGKATLVARRSGNELAVRFPR